MTILSGLADQMLGGLGGNREIDCRIWCEINGHTFVRWIHHSERVTWGDIEGSDRKAVCNAGMVFERKGGADYRNARFQQHGATPHYTSDLTAAMSLVPADHTVQLSDWEDERLRLRGAWQAIVLPRGVRGRMTEYTFTNRCDHAGTAALALSCAALRARASIIDREVSK